MGQDQRDPNPSALKLPITSPDPVFAGERDLGDRGSGPDRIHITPSHWWPYAASEEDSICAVVGLSAFIGRGVQMGMFCAAPVQRVLFASKRPDGFLFKRWIED